MNVTPLEILRFCAWAGLALPTWIEWQKAATGTEEHYLRCEACLSSGGKKSERRNEAVDCPNCDNTGRVPRTFPWGGGTPLQPHMHAVCGRHYGASGTSAVMTEAVTSADVLRVAQAIGALGSLPIGFPQETFGSLILAMAEKERTHKKLVPSRPNGASPYGAQDIFGNAWEVTDTLTQGGFWAAGGSWKTPPAHLSFRLASTIPSEEYRDDFGFRVVLRA